MDVLKRIKGSTLMETLVATVLIVVVFMMASLTLNTLFSTTITTNDEPVRQELLFLQYTFDHGKLSLPYYGELDAWDISVQEQEVQGTKTIVFLAVNTINNREVTYTK
ncbi:hypothetical protein [Flagellimonas sp.]|uniref:hypothetical protein n=1 Tax=Flagellimonas sp. TaxID=2058762 RepID=UPI003BA854D8